MSIGYNPYIEAPVKQAKAVERIADSFNRMAVALESISTSLETISVNSKRESVEDAVVGMKSSLADAISRTPLDIAPLTGDEIR